MDTLKEKLVSPPLLTLPKQQGISNFGTDACDRQVGCVLLEKQDDGKDQPIRYWSRACKATEKYLDTTHRECHAVVWTVLLLQPNLEGLRFIICTDHHVLQWILNSAEASRHLGGWRLRIPEFDFKIVHWAGIKNQAADSSSRLQTTRSDSNDL